MFCIKIEWLNFDSTFLRLNKYFCTLLKLGNLNKSAGKIWHGKRKQIQMVRSLTNMKTLLQLNRIMLMPLLTATISYI